MSKETEQFSQKSLRRIQKSKINTTVAFVTSIIMGIFSFIERTTFNQFFISDYLGLYSFNYNIIYTLAYVELGLGTSIAYALYKPLEENNKGQIVAIIRFFRLAYIAVGCFLIVSGIAILPFLKYLIKTTVPIRNVQVYFVLFLLGNASGYILTYKNVLFNANQESYKVTFIANSTWTIIYIVEILIAYRSQNFLHYSMAIFLGHLGKNIVMRIMANREFKYLKKVPKEKIDASIMSRIKKNTVGMISNRIGQVMVSSTDSMLISAMVGTAILGKYSNYQMLNSGLLSLSVLIPQAITASVGNAAVSLSKRSLTKGFYSIELGTYFVSSVLTLILFNVSNPIISSFFGSDKVLPLSTLSLICLSFYFSSIRELLLTYKSSLGLYWEDKIRPIAEGLVNLVFSLLLGHYIGLNGIIIGTIISQVFVNFIIEPRIIFHRGLMHSTIKFYFSNIIRLLLTVALCILTSFILSKVNVLDSFNFNINIKGLVIPVQGIVQIVINFLITITITLLVFLLIYRKSPYAKEIIKTLKVAFSSKTRKKAEKKIEEEVTNIEHEVPPDALS